jgi:predicted O-methyltransferase YrrM
MACARCGLVFLNPRMTAEAYGRFYDGVYRPLVSAFHGRLIDARTIQDEQREYAADRAAFALPYLGGRGLETMLDIGGSTGVVAAHFANAFGSAAPSSIRRRSKSSRRARSGWRRSPASSRSTTSAIVDSTSC